MPKPRDDHEFFYWENRRRQDKGLHEPILDSGDHDAAAKVSADVMRKLGFKDAEIKALLHPAKAVRKEFDESEHPRDQDGKFTFAGGGGEDTAEAEPNPDAMSVGGDAWNRQTAARLEGMYAKEKAHLHEIAASAVGQSVERPSGDDEDNEDDAPYVPEEWSMLSDDQQNAALEAYKSQTYNDYLDSEIQNWQENSAEDDARYKVASDFDKGQDIDWAKDAIAEWRDSLKGTVPLSDEQLLDAVTISHDTGNYPVSKGTDVDIDWTKFPPKDSQPDLPGIEPPDYTNLGNSLVEAVKDAFEKRAEDVQDDLEPPDYLSDSVAEFQEESWSSMDDSDKFSWVSSNTSIIEDAQAESDKYHEGKNVLDTVDIEEVPDKLDPLNNTSGDDYRVTQALARYMSRTRAAELFVERGIKDGDGDAFNNEADAADAINKADSKLWNGWKSSSAGQLGWLLQVATHAELGGRLREKGYPEHTHQMAVDFANSDFREVGGFDGVKAMIRAKWETTQYLLDKAGMQTLETYRGLKVPPTGVDSDGKVVDFQLVRNGAQSATTELSVARSFAGSSGTVIRLQVPRTAVISVPAYGINVHSEREVVVAGTAWKAWDAWQATKTPHHSQRPVPTEQAA